MRVAYVCADRGVPVFGRKGCSVHVQEIIRAFEARGAIVDLFAVRRDGEAPRDLRVRVHPLPAPAGGDVAAREREAIAANYPLRLALERAGPFDLVYERYSLWSTAGMEYASARGIPGVLEVNSPLIEEQARHRGLVDRAGAERSAARAFAAATLLVAVSDEVAASVERHTVAPGRVHVIPNGVDPARFRPRDIHRPAGAPFTIGFVGTLKPWHGLPTLVEAFALVNALAPDARLLIVGEGPERERVETDAARFGVNGAVRLTGAVDPPAVPALLASMHVACAPYPHSTGFYFSPLKVLEYMAAGLPVVASRVGQLARLVVHERTGLLCPAGDAAALATALERLRHDPALRARLGRAARAAVTRGHTWDAVVRRVIALAGLEASPAHRNRVEVAT
ncbi:MAG: glycosyltransferase family 4 protein [Gemmatimonadota bacterium]|nr:glycosyltransferase family 4 protein [Gemmatimonadota bacterium]